ncbi:lactate racemase domain-containing protein [Thermasporomyces composti]|jgi:nickel-dependent lactate racemase|uniref:Nickel-dependent lactate racemase n=1 Tax=Thermasporomyces composti TaxID=696763 RepID=A0A3D9V854_THECX|nr:lactate racemase domain-containing protein [Thermasporomyces composti]REF37978.1 nickel-dependent lactate racemase [Thermasporomyces composti]
MGSAVTGAGLDAGQVGGPGVELSSEEARRFVRERLRSVPLEGRSLCVVVPDSTRSCPLPLLLRGVHEAVHGRVSRLTVLIALGTHPPMSDAQLATHLGYAESGLAATYPGTSVVNHEWWDPDALVEVGVIPAAEVAELSGGRLTESVVVRVNRHVVEHDVVLVVGPVFPHEVVGFSGGNKYFFPGVAGREVIDTSHWLGALIGSARIIGTLGVTPVRALIDRAASLIPSERLCLAAVVASGTATLHALTFGTPEEAWARAAEVSARTHVRYLDRPVRRVLSLVSERYDELWTAAKGMYKVEPVVADGGEVVLYAPHVREVSRTHGAAIEKVGYHCQEYFTGQWERFRDVPRSVLAHSSHLRGAGSYDPEHGERCRITVTLATGLDEATTRALGLEYRDPASIDVDEWAGDPDTLVVPDAGEVLFRLGGPTVGASSAHVAPSAR